MNNIHLLPIWPLLQAAENFYSFLTYSTRENQSGGFTRTASNATGNVLSIYPDGFLPLINTDIDDFSLFAGYRWETASGWGFDLRGGYGDNEFGFFISNSLNASFGDSSPTGADAGTLVLDQATFNFDASKLYDQGSIPFNVAWGAEYRDEGCQIKPGEPVSYQAGEQKNPFTGQNYAPGFQVFLKRFVMCCWTTISELRSSLPTQVKRPLTA